MPAHYLRHTSRLLALAGLLVPLGAQEFAPVAGLYHDRVSVESILQRWVGADPEGLRLHEFGTDPEQRVVGIELGGVGPLPLEERPVVWVFGGMDGISLVGGEAALHALSTWLGDRSKLPGDVSLLVVPWASPRELAATLRGGPQALLDDGQDVDGDGAVLEMLVEHPEGEWVRVDGTRLLARADSDDASRLRRWVEGGSTPVGQPRGMQVAFPGGERFGSAAWEGPGRALADMLLERRTAAVVVLAGAGAEVARPLSCLPEDLPWYERLASGWCDHLPDADELDHEGISTSPFLDWCYLVLGVPAVELRLWQPPMVAELLAGDGSWSDMPRVAVLDRRWDAWLDQGLGGFGFVDWRPVDQGDGVRAWVGGWRARTRYNPPEDALESALAPVAPFVRKLLMELPRLELAVVESTRDKDLVRLVVELRARGKLPLAMGCAGRWSGGAGLRDPWIELSLPVGATRLAGPSSGPVPELRGGGPVRIEWLFSAPEASSFVLKLGAPGAAPVERSMQP